MHQHIPLVELHIKTKCYCKIIHHCFTSSPSLLVSIIFRLFFIIVLPLCDNLMISDLSFLNISFTSIRHFKSRIAFILNLILLSISFSSYMIRDNLIKESFCFMLFALSVLLSPIFLVFLLLSFTSITEHPVCSLVNCRQLFII